MEGRPEIKRDLQIPLRERSPDYFRRLVHILRSESPVGRSDVFSSDEHISRVLEEASREFPLEPDVIDLNANLRQHRLHPAPADIPDGDDNVPEVLVMPPAVIELPRHEDTPPSDAYAPPAPVAVVPRRPGLRRRTRQQIIILNCLQGKITFFGGLWVLLLPYYLASERQWRIPAFWGSVTVFGCSIAAYLLYSSRTNPGEPPGEERFPPDAPNRRVQRRTTRK